MSKKSWSKFFVIPEQNLLLVPNVHLQFVFWSDALVHENIFVLRARILFGTRNEYTVHGLQLRAMKIREKKLCLCWECGTKRCAYNTRNETARIHHAEWNSAHTSRGMKQRVYITRNETARIHRAEWNATVLNSVNLQSQELKLRVFDEYRVWIMAYGPSMSLKFRLFRSNIPDNFRVGFTGPDGILKVFSNSVQ
jgi:hypothetical protein